MQQALLYQVIGLINFVWLAKSGMFHLGAFVLFLFLVIAMATKRN